MPFDQHPDQDLHNAFQGFQGCQPADAEIVVVGSDANWPTHIGGEAFTQCNFYTNFVAPYLLSGGDWYSKTGSNLEVLWPVPWPTQMEGVQHPFLVPFCNHANNTDWDPIRNQLRRAGFTYHMRWWAAFSMASRDVDNLANRISFIELLPTPTVGSSTEDAKAQNRYLELLNQNLQRSQNLLSQAFDANRRKLVIFMLGRRISRLKIYFPQEIRDRMVMRIPTQDIPVVNLNHTGDGNHEVYNCGHFSFSFSDRSVWSVAAKIRDFLNDSDN